MSFLRSTLIASAVVAYCVLVGVAFAQQQDSNVFTGGSVYSGSNVFTNPTVNQQGTNANTTQNVNSSTNANTSTNAYTGTNANEQTGANAEYNPYSQSDSLSVENNPYEQNGYYQQTNVQGSTNAYDSYTGQLVDPNANTDIYLNDQYNVANTYNPFVGIGHDVYNPWQQSVFYGTYQSWYGTYNTPQGTANNLQGTAYDSSQSDIFDSKDPNQLTVFKTSPNSVSNNGVTSASQGSACLNPNLSTFGGVIYYIVCIINAFLLQISLTLALIYFMWGVIQYMTAAGNAEERRKARQSIIYGVIAMFVVVSIWGIVKLFKVTFGL